MYHARFARSLISRLTIQVIVQQRLHRLICVVQSKELGPNILLDILYLLLLFHDIENSLLHAAPGRAIPLHRRRMPHQLIRNIPIALQHLAPHSQLLHSLVALPDLAVLQRADAFQVLRPHGRNSELSPAGQHAAHGNCARLVSE